MSAALPGNESERLAILSQYSILDTPPETSYDRITRTAKRVFDVPICLVTLVDEKRQFFKSKIGLTVSETPRDQAFCAYGILQDEVLVVPDATKDERFAANPLVIGYPNIRFYAGAQLITKEGFKLGSLCVIDTQPRLRPSAEQLCILEDLAAQAVELLEAGKGKREIDDLQCDLRSIRQTLQLDRKRWHRMEQTAALALDAGQMGFWEWDEQGKSGRWSERMFSIMGLPVGSATPSLKEWLKLAHPEDRAALRRQFDEILRWSGQPFTMKYRLRSPGKEDGWITMVGNHYLDEAGVRLGALGVAWDSSEAARKERAITESEELFRGLSASSPVGIFRADLRGNVTYGNPRLSEIWKVPDPESLKGLNWAKRVHPDDLDGLTQGWFAANSKGLPFEREYRLVALDETIRWVSGRSAVVHDSEGEPVCTVGTVDDITDRKRTLEDLRNAKEAAEIASRSKDIFLANVSHELRTPLNGVLGMMELLLDTELGEEQRQMAEIVLDSGHSLLRVVNEILELSRAQASRLVIENQVFDWNLMVGQVLAHLKPQADLKGISLQMEQPAGMATRFVGDAERIKQILVIYLTNALKFTPAGSVTVKVDTQPLEPSGMDQMPDAASGCELLVMVRDTGPGISTEDQAKLFQPFSQLDPSSTRTHGGVGLGLAIARRLAELMGGSVGVVSSVGEGAVFWLRLPLPLFSEAPAQQDQQPAPTDGVKTKQRVLLVEDHPENQRVILNMLWKLGCQADLVSDGRTALDMMRRTHYSLVLMDCIMPELDGFRTTEEIRRWEKDQRMAAVPIVALTAQALAGDRERCVDAGMNDYLSKPLGLDALRSVLDRWARVSKQSAPDTVLA